MKKFLILFLALSMPVMALDADTRAFVDRLDRVERDMTLLQRKVYRDGGVAGVPVSGSDETASYGRVSDLEQAVQALTQQIEEIQNQNQTLSLKLKKMEDDNAFRLELMEKQIQEMMDAQKAAKAVPASASASAKAPLPVKSTGNAKNDYDAAYKMLSVDNYAGAEKAFQAFIQNYPNDPLADNAGYWLGETYYVRKMYREAAVSFAKGVQKGKAKGADSLLKLGMSMAFLNQKEEACTAFASVPIEFPKADTVLINRAKSEAKKIGCP